MGVGVYVHMVWSIMDASKKIANKSNNSTETDSSCGTTSTLVEML